MSDWRDCPPEAPVERPSARSLHLWSERPAPTDVLPCKPDRILIGVVAGIALFYLLGRALGLGHRGHSG